MIKLDPKINELPFSNEELQEISITLFNKVDLDKLKEEGTKIDENLFHKKDVKSIEEAFTVKYKLIYTNSSEEENDKIDFYIEEIKLLESEDEFFEEYKRLKSLKDQ